MPRVYISKSTKPYKRYDPLILKTAIEAYETGNKSLVEIAKQFNIAKSVLHRHVTRTMKSQGGQKALSEETEKYIIKYINICSEWGYPLDTFDLRKIIKGYLDKVGIEIKKFNNNLPGVDYVEGFLKRHKKEISARISQNIKRSRAAVSPQIIEDYFRELQNSLEDVPLSNIVNYDESNLADDPGKKKVLTKRGVKYPERVMNHTKSSTSLMMAASADGTLLPCYVVYKAGNLYNTWTTNGPPNCRYNRTSSGWFDSNTFDDWVETVAISYFSNKPGKKILIGDNLSSHLSLEVIKKCQEHNIHFVFLPPNSTHLTQPLDIAFFRPMKIAWRNILFTWKKCEGRVLPTIPKNVFPKLLKKLLETMEPNTKQNILAGFMKAGISPLNKNKVLNRLPGNNIRHEFSMEDKEAIDESILSLLKEMRYGSHNTRTINKSKKINVIPGKSVEDSEYIDSNITSLNGLSDVDSKIASTSKNCAIRNQTDRRNEETNQTNNKNKNPTLTAKENLISQAPRLKNKGVGKKSKPQNCNNKLNKDSEVLQEKQILKEQKNLNIDLTDIDKMPVILLEDDFNVIEDNFTVTEDNFLVTEDHRQKHTQQPKIRILSDVIYKGNMKKPIELKPSANRHRSSSYYEDKTKLSEPKPGMSGFRRSSNYENNTEPKPDTSGLRRLIYYKNDMEILRDLMDSDVV